MKDNRQRALRAILFAICLAALGALAAGADSRAAFAGEENNGERNMADNGTKVRLVVGETVIPAVLNDGKAAEALIAKLPYTVRLARYEHDYCGVMDALPYDTEDVHNGWRNGDIAFTTSGNYFAILYKDEEISQEFDGLVTMGSLDGDPMIMETLERSISVRIELQ